MGSFDEGTTQEARALPTNSPPDAITKTLVRIAVSPMVLVMSQCSGGGHGFCVLRRPSKARPARATRTAVAGSGMVLMMKGLSSAPTSGSRKFGR